MLALWYAFWNLLDWGAGAPAGEPVVARPGERCGHVLTAGSHTIALTPSQYTTLLRQVWE